MQHTHHINIRPPIRWSFCTTKQNPPQMQWRKFWLGCISFSRTRDVLDLLSLGSNIQKILSRIQA